MSQQTITINGTVYDAHTGMPLHKVTKTVAKKHTPSTPHHSHEMHRQVQKSQTLNRRVVKKIVAQQHAVVHKKHQPTATPVAHAKSPTITKFAPHPTGPSHRPRVMSDIGPSTHPMVKKAHERMQPKPAITAPSKHHATSQPSAVLKKEATIATALEKAPSHKAGHKPVKSAPKKFQRVLSVASASLALLLLGGYFTYLNMPSLSVRVAAAQAGINASYPTYHPDGYGRGVVGYSNGEVSVKYASNAGPQNFTLTQEKTTLDSTALKENYVDKQWGENIDIVTERGLTIYRKDGNAMWVNGGILYTINGDAPLSPTQIRNIATSL